MLKTVPVHFAAVFGAFAAIIVISIGLVKPRGFDPDAACVGNQRVVAEALLQYVQDNDEKLPNMQTAQTFDAAMGSYVSRYPDVLNCPATGYAYKPNVSLSYRVVASIADYYTTTTFKDAVPHPDGAVTVAFFDQHIEQNGVVQGDPHSIALQNAEKLDLSIAEYAQDWDERFPPMQPQSAFQAAVISYAKDPSIFRNPDNHRLFRPNAALSYISYSQIQHPATTRIFSDDAGITAFADNHIDDHGKDVYPPRDPGSSNLSQISLACEQYEQDYEGGFPPLNSYTSFEAALRPYVPDPAVFVEPGTDVGFELNASLNGKSVNDVTDPGTTFLVQDSALEQGGIKSVAYVDGHIASYYYYVPSGLTIGHSRQPALIWTAANGTGSIWDLNRNGVATQTADYTGDLPNYSSLLGVATYSGDKRLLLWSGQNGLVNLQATTTSGAVGDKYISGPYDGWSPVSIANDASRTRILWNRYDGETALWNVLATGKYVRSTYLSHPANQQPIAVAVGAAGSTEVLFKELDGSADVWKLAASGAIQSQLHYATSEPTQSIVGFALGDDGLIRLLFDDKGGNAEIETLDATGNNTGTIMAHQGQDAIPGQIVVGQSGDLFLLWKEMHPGQGAVLDRLHPDGTLVYRRRYQPYM